jgi:signal transduction histidine kinase
MNSRPIKVLLIEDNPGDVTLIREFLSAAGDVQFELDDTDSLSAAMERLSNGDIDVILLDLCLLDSCGFETFTSLCSQVPHLPIIVLTGLMDEEVAIRAVKEGAQEYLVKGEVGGNLLIRSIRYAIERKQIEEELKSSREQLRNLSTYLQTVREEERTHIARELHDELGQALTALKMDLSWLARKLPKQQILLEKTESMSHAVTSIIHTVKRICTKLRPSLLDDLGLPAAIEWQAREFQERTQIACEVSLDPDVDVRNKDLSTAIFRIFQESLTNVARHAQATKVTVKLESNDRDVMLLVEDNGKGLTNICISHSKSYGIIGMRERARSFGGDVTIKSLPGKYTTVSVCIPLD